MKKSCFFLLIAFLACSFTIQNDTEAIVQSFKSGNAEEIAKYFDDYVDMKLLDKDEIKNIGHNQASIALKQFYTENGVKGFEKISDREIGNTMYMTGKLITGGKGYNITVMLKQKGGKHYIITLRIN